MAPRQNRQERRLERQRGAGTRQIQNLDFGLVISGENASPLPLQKSGRSRRTPSADVLLPQPSSRRTPASQLRPTISSGRTPATGVVPPSQERGRQRSISVPGKRQRSPTRDTDHGGDGQRSSAKRAKTKPQHGTVSEETPVLLPQDESNEIDRKGHSTSASEHKKRKKRKPIGQQATKRTKPISSPAVQRQPHNVKVKRGRPIAPQMEEREEDIEGSIQEQLRRENADLEPQAYTRPDHSILPSVEPTEGTGFTPRQKKRKKRVSVGQQARKKAKPLTTVKEESVEEEPIPLDQVEEEQPGVNEDGDEQDDLNDESEAANAVKQLEQQKPKRKKRKSIGQQRPSKASLSKKKALHASPQQPMKPSGQRVKAPVVTDPSAALNEPAADSDEEHEEVDATDQSPPRRKPRGRPSLAPRKASKMKTSTKPPKPPQAISTTKAPKAPKPTSSRGPASNKVPITIYRPPTPSSSASPSAPADNPPSSPIPTSKTFNPVDVLAQITLERLTNIATKITSKPTTSKTQQKALELYTTEIEQRMRQLSKALDLNAVLKTRVKRLAKEERELKRGVKEVEKEAKEVRERKEGLEKRKERVELEGLLGRIAAVARKGWEMEKGEGNVD